MGNTSRSQVNTLKAAAGILREADDRIWSYFLGMITADPDVCHFCNLEVVGRIQEMLGEQVTTLAKMLHPKNDAN